MCSDYGIFWPGQLHATRSKYTRASCAVWHCSSTVVVRLCSLSFRKARAVAVGSDVITHIYTQVHRRRRRRWVPIENTRAARNADFLCFLWFLRWKFLQSAQFSALHAHGAVRHVSRKIRLQPSHTQHHKRIDRARSLTARVPKFAGPLIPPTRDAGTVTYVYTHRSECVFVRNWS